MSRAKSKGSNSIHLTNGTADTDADHVLSSDPTTRQRRRKSGAVNSPDLALSSTPAASSDHSTPLSNSANATYSSASRMTRKPRKPSQSTTTNSSGATNSDVQHAQSDAAPFSFPSVSSDTPALSPSSILSYISRKREIDIGERIAFYILPYVPLSWHPNFITIVNHCTNWLLFITAWFAPSIENDALRVFCYILCAVFCFSCAMMDCLDGMQARRTNQCSFLGEFLDHYSDSIHVPLVSSSLLSALRVRRDLYFLNMILSVLVYHGELLVFHFDRVFVQTGGMGGQLTCCILFLFGSYLSFLPESHILVQLTGTGLAILVAVVTSQLLLAFTVRFDRIMWTRFVCFAAFLFGVAAFHLQSHLSLLSGVLMISFLSYRITGQYVLFTLIAKTFKGYDTHAPIYAILSLYLCFCVPEVPVSFFLSALPSQLSALATATSDFPMFASTAQWTATYVNDLTSVEWLQVTVQQILPFVWIAHMAVLNVQMFFKYYYRLRNA